MSLAPPSARFYTPGALIDADFELAALGRALWRQRSKILRPTIAVALITFLIVLMIPAKYQSEARVLLISHDNIYLRPDADKGLTDSNVIDEEAVTSQVQLILSRDLAKEVIAKLKLNTLPEFDPALSGVSLLKSLLGFFGVIRNPLSMTPQERVLEAYYDRLSVFPVAKSRVIVIDFLSQDPKLAARVANAVADAYLERQQLAKQDQARHASAWLFGEIERLRTRVADDETKVEAFRAKSNLLVGPSNTTLSAQQLGDLNAQLAAARAQKADAEARAKIIRAMLNSGETIESSDILNSELIRRLSEQRVTLRAQLAEQSSSLLGNHPRIKELKAQIDDLNLQIRKEAETIARSLENDAKLADAKVAAQLATLDKLKSQAATSNADDVQLRALERDAKSQRDLLVSYLAKYREASARGTVASEPPDARVISRATVSTVPAYPKKLPTVLIASLATMVLCSGWVLTRELLASPSGAVGETFGEDFDETAAMDKTETVDAPVRASAGKRARAPIRVPRFARRGDAPRSPDAAADPRTEPAGPFKREPTPDTRAAPNSSAAKRTPSPAAPVAVPASAIEEFARNLRQIGFAGTQMAFFAATPSLDVSGIAIKFARALERDARVVLVGLGWGDGAIAAISAAADAPGLAELAAGTASFGDIITKDKASSLNLITAGRADLARGALIAAPEMAKNFAALALTYDYVVINAGPLRGGDIAAIARLAPHAVVLVETLATLATTKASDVLIDAGFDDVTILVDGKSGAATRSPQAAA